jgi:hypothetical protein
MMGSVKRIRPLHNANLNSQGGAENWVNGIRGTRRGPQLQLTSTRSSIPITMRGLLHLGPNVPVKYTNVAFSSSRARLKAQNTSEREHTYDTKIEQKFQNKKPREIGKLTSVTCTHFNMFLTVISSADQCELIQILLKSSNLGNIMPALIYDIYSRRNPECEYKMENEKSPFNATIISVSSLAGLCDFPYMIKNRANRRMQRTRLTERVV